jgi:spore coat polysaccharide biosynthesis protein SpsF
MQALNFIPAEIRILACPEDSAEAFAGLAEEAGFTLFVGPKEDVLGRYCMVIRHFGIRHVIRATGDNPFVFTDAAAAINAESMTLNADYSGYSGLPVGAGVESVSAAALIYANAQAAASYEREHVCPYLYYHPEIFRLHRPLSPLAWQDTCFGASANIIRLTVDTPEDYERAQKLYASLGHEPLRYRGQEIIKRYQELFFS